MTTAYVARQHTVDWLEAGSVVEQLQTIFNLLLNEDYRLIDPRSEGYSLISTCERLLSDLNALLGALEMQATTCRGGGVE
jgi:hypothetical protein